RPRDSESCFDGSRGPAVRRSANRPDELRARGRDVARRRRLRRVCSGPACRAGRSDDRFAVRVNALAHHRRYIGRRGGKPPSQTWRTFLANHLQQLAAADFFVVPTATCRLLFVLVILAHERRRVVHVAVTDHPTAAWTRNTPRSVSLERG